MLILVPEVIRVRIMPHVMLFVISLGVLLNE
jgi:hypothetical protein